MLEKYPYYKGKLPKYMIVDRDGISYTAKISFIVNQSNNKNIKKYLDFRNKLDILGLYFVDTDTGSKKRKQQKYIYIWTKYEEDDNFRDSYDDYITFLKLTFPQFTKK